MEDEMTAAPGKDRDKLQASVMRLAITRWIRDATSDLAPLGGEPIEEIRVIDMADEAADTEDPEEDLGGFGRFAEGTRTGDES
jgi:hypothetical protein